MLRHKNVFSRVVFQIGKYLFIYIKKRIKSGLYVIRFYAFSICVCIGLVCEIDAYGRTF